MVGGTGRKKIEIKRKDSKADRMVTFSKRRKGLFRKAMELCSISGCQIAVLIFSPASRPYTHGDPDFDSILDQFLAKYYSDVIIPTSSNSSSPTTATSAIQPPGDELNDDANRDNAGPVGSDDDASDCGFDDGKDMERSSMLECMRVEEFEEEEELLFLKKELEKGRTDIVKEMTRKLIHTAFV